MYIRDQKFVFTPLHEITQGAGAVDPAQAERERQLQRAERFGVEFREPPKDQFGQVKRYANPFLLAEEKAKKKEERGLRFGLIDPEEKAKKEMRLQKFGPLVPASTTQDEKEAEEPEEDKGKGLELEEEEGEEEESMDVETREPKKEWPVEVKRRQETLYLYGTDKMSTEDVFKYFVEYKPQFVEWIDDSSCNVVFDDHGSAAQAFVGVSDPADDEVVAVPPGGLEVMYVWRRGKQLWRNHTLLLRFATIEDRRPVVPKKSAYVEEMLRKRAEQRNKIPSIKVSVSITKERQQLKTQNKKNKKERRRRADKRGDTTDPLKKAVISTMGLDDVGDSHRLKRGLRFAPAAERAQHNDGSTGVSIFATDPQPQEPTMAVIPPPQQQPHHDELL